MDIKSIVRVFRFNELQNRADRDPEAKRPPTVKFMGLALVLGLLLVLISFWSAPQTDVNGAFPLQLASPSESPGTNETSAPTPGEQQGPVPPGTVSESAAMARPQDGP